MVFPVYMCVYIDIHLLKYENEEIFEEIIDFGDKKKDMYGQLPKVVHRRKRLL